MTKIETFYRKADVPASEAISQILKRFSKAELVAFETKEATPSEARTAKVQPGAQVFAATLKISEAPPIPEESEGAPPEPEFGGADDGPPAAGPSDDGPEDSEPKEEKPEGEEKSDSKPPKEKSEGGEAEGDGLGEKLKPEEEMVHLLKQILDAVGGGAGALGTPKPPVGPGGPPHHGPPGGPPGAGAPPGPPGAGLDTPDIGAPGPPQHGGPPLPPPVDKQPGGLAFSHYDPSATSFAVIRRDANELGLRGLRAEAEATYPTHRVAHMTTAGEATVNGLKVDIAGNNIAVLTLTKR